ncbi:MAG: hypothetical protein Kow0077_00260 [Anaerolineae bacterium]
MAGHIFISYSKRDSEFAFKLADSLVEAGRRVWIDRQIEGGERWRTSISQALRECSECIVVLSPRSVASDWVLHEGSVASGLDKPIYPVLLEPIERLPVWMEEVQYIDFHGQPFEEAFKQLIGALTPPNPLQDLLDQQLQAHHQTGELIGEALLHVLDEERENLTISPEAEELIQRSKQAVAYRRRLVRASAGAAIVLSVIALIAGIIAIRSGAEIATAQRNLNAAQTEIADAARELAAQEAEAATAQAQQMEAEALVAAAQTEQAVVQQNLATATAAIGLANEQLEEAQTRLNTAETQLVRLFQTTGTVPVGTQPRAMLWNGSEMWVANGDGTLMRINVKTGIADQTVPLNTTPTAITWDGEALWVALQESNTLRRMDPETGATLVDFQTGNGPSALAWDGDSVWVANRRDNTVQRFYRDDAAPYGWSEGETIPVGTDPRALAWDGNALWVANRGSNSVQRINPLTGSASDPIPVGEGPTALAWDGRNLWIANRNESTVMTLDPATRTIVQTIPVNKFPSDLVWDGVSIWVTNDGRDSVMQIEPSSGEILLEIETGRDPRVLAWDGEDVWVANLRDNSVVRVRADEAAVLETLPLTDVPAALTVTEDGLSIASTAAQTVRHLNLSTTPIREYTNTLSAAPTSLISLGDEVIIARDDGSIQRLDPANGAIFDRLEVALSPDALAYDGEQLWIASAEAGAVYAVNPFNGVQIGREITVGQAPQGLLWDGERLWVANTGDGTVMRVNTSIGLVWSPVTVGEAPGAMAWDGSSLWVANSGSNTLTQLAPSGTVLATVNVEANPVALAWDGISLWVACRDANVVQQVDPITATVEATVAVDERPIALAWDGSTLWVATGSSTLQKINTQSLNLIMLARRLALQTQY